MSLVQSCDTAPDRSLCFNERLCVLFVTAADIMTGVSTLNHRQEEMCDIQHQTAQLFYCAQDATGTDQITSSRPWTNKPSNKRKARSPREDQVIEYMCHTELTPAYSCNNTYIRELKWRMMERNAGDGEVRSMVEVEWGGSQCHVTLGSIYYCVEGEAEHLLLHTDRNVSCITLLDWMSLFIRSQTQKLIFDRCGSSSAFIQSNQT